MNKELRDKMLDLAYAKCDEVYGASQKREFDCLIALIENGSIKSFEELAEYGIERD